MTAFASFSTTCPRMEGGAPSPTSVTPRALAPCFSKELATMLGENLLIRLGAVLQLRP
jgi:hypothetical protein